MEILSLDKLEHLRIHTQNNRKLLVKILERLRVLHQHVPPAPAVREPTTPGAATSSSNGGGGKQPSTGGPGPKGYAQKVMNGTISEGLAGIDVTGPPNFVWNSANAYNNGQIKCYGSN